MSTTASKVRLPLLQLYQEANGDWRWRLRAANRKIIAVSGEGYRNFAHCDKMAGRILEGFPMVTRTVKALKA